MAIFFKKSESFWLFVESETLQGWGQVGQSESSHLAAGTELKGFILLSGFSFLSQVEHQTNPSLLK